MISVIIPTLNSERTIGKCLEAVLGSSYKDYEVIVSDGGSRDRTIEISKGTNDIRIRVFQKKDDGAAQGRNNGARNAAGQILFFVDADVVIKRDTLTLVAADFAGTDASAVCGCYDKASVNSSFGPAYDSLRKHYDWTSVKDRYCDFFTTARGAVRRDVFSSLGGFDERLKGTLANEDLEFGCRMVNAGYKMLKDDRIIVRHFGPTFWHNLNMFYARSGSYFKMFLKKKKFENVKTTKGSAVNCFLALLGTVVLPFFWPLGAAILLVHVSQNAKFLSFVAAERGPVFALKSVGANYMLAMAAASGAVTAAFSLPFEKVKG
ncbi:MAG: glycosyltransferase [Candidatus Aenigmatarchaeota archaeon]